MKQAYAEERRSIYEANHLITETKILIKFLCRNLKNLPYS